MLIFVASVKVLATYIGVAVSIPSVTFFYTDDSYLIAGVLMKGSVCFIFCLKCSLPCWSYIQPHCSFMTGFSFLLAGVNKEACFPSLSGTKMCYTAIETHIYIT